MKTAIAGFILCFLTTAVHAHSPLLSTSPADGAVLSTAPTEVTATFAKGIRLTRVQLIDATDTSVDLDLTDYGAFGTEFLFIVPAITAGQFRIDWRGLGEDGHILNGSFEFTVE